MYTGFASMPSWAIKNFEEMFSSNTNVYIDSDPIHHSEIVNILYTGKPIIASNPIFTSPIISGIFQVLLADDDIVISMDMLGRSLVITVFADHLQFFIISGSKA